MHQRSVLFSTSNPLTLFLILWYFKISRWWNSSSVLQILLIRDKLPSRGQLPKWSLYQGQWEALSSACTSLNSLTFSIHTWLGLCWTNICFLQGYVPPAKNGLEQKRPGRPLNITSLVRLSSAVPNHISVTWSPEIGKVRVKNVNIPVELMKSQLWGFGLVTADPLPLVFQTYSLSVYLVRQLTSPLLLQRLKMKGIRNPDHSRALSNSTLHRVLISAVYQFVAK